VHVIFINRGGILIAQGYSGSNTRSVTMIRNIALLFLLLLPTLAMAQLDSEFVFNGQNAEVLVAEKPVTIVTPETVEVPSTCSRQVPNGQREVCRNETRYRQECSWVPASTQCSNYQERVCRPV